MDDELDTSIDSSAFDDSGSDFADASDYNDSMDVESIMDDVPVEPIDDFPNTAMDTDFSEDFTTDANVSDLMEDDVEYEPSENLEADSVAIIDVDEVPNEPEEIASVNEPDIDAIMNNEADGSSELAFDGDDSIIDTGTDINGDIPSTEEEDIQPNADELMDENADEQVENTELENDNEISESTINDTDDTDDEIAADIVDIMDEAALEELDEYSHENEENINVEELMENEAENDDIESSAGDINNNDENSEVIDIQDATLEDGDNLNEETNIQFEDTIETDESQKVLKRDEFELLSQGNANINDILDVKADDYRDKGFDEDEIARKLENDKLELQQEFLNDAFPNQDVAPAVFNGFEENRIKEPSINSVDSILDGSPIADVDAIESSEVDINSIDENSETGDILNATLEDGDNLDNDTDVSFEKVLENNDFQKVLKKDELSLLEEGDRAIQRRLDAKADDYRDKKYPEDEISVMLAADKLEYQKEFLSDAFPGQEVNPGVFRHINENFDTSLNADMTEITPLENVDGLLSDIDANDNISQDITENEDVYTATPISDIQIVQEDDSVDSIENIMNNLDAEVDSGEVAYDIPIKDTPYTPSIDEISTMQRDDLADVEEKIPSESEDTIQDEFTEIAPLENIDGWIKDVNPNFDEFDIDSPYCNNCGSCAYAVYQRLEGNPDVCATAENIGYNNEMEALTGMEQVSMSPQEIEQRLLDEGNGAHAIIGIDRAEGAGHWFNAACIDGKVVAIDGQDGSVSGWPPDYGDVINWEMSVRKETNNGQEDY